MESSIQRRDQYSTRDQAIYPPAITARNRQRGDQGHEQAGWEGAEVATSPSSSILTVWTSQISRWIACMPVSLIKENANSRGSKNVQQHLLFIQLFSTPWTAPCQTFLSSTYLLKFAQTQHHWDWDRCHYTAVVTGQRSVRPSHCPLTKASTTEHLTQVLVTALHHQHHAKQKGVDPFINYLPAPSHSNIQ